MSSHLISWLTSRRALFRSLMLISKEDRPDAEEKLVFGYGEGREGGRVEVGEGGVVRDVDEEGERRRRSCCWCE